MGKHSPAPWTLKIDRGANRASIFAANGLRVISLPSAADRPYEQKEADARLIAAAPDLLAALELAMRGGFASPESVEQVMRAAITKARSGSLQDGR